MYLSKGELAVLTESLVRKDLQWEAWHVEVKATFGWAQVVSELLPIQTYILGKVWDGGGKSEIFFHISEIVISKKDLGQLEEAYSI